ncbi:MAG: adenylyltransferase/cytidyltransferase family protein [Candidatus Omnitrophica bacterium]|nr:adenylyltransferase/cytidyltransferase family protein [Candidatus Omnitrophota bacterium]
MTVRPEERGYQRKIKSREELRQIIGPRPRPRKVIMCHGTFDLVHPGHIRHLMYAKSKADILITSLTCDAHIAKANFRPFVPQDLRAMNLAALEVVDYVMVDENPTPIDTIAFLQPDFFAKGYEYSKDGLHPKTREELKVLESYGGELIFTPGDIVYSSSLLLESGPPKLSAEKLVTLMESEGITFDGLRKALDDFDRIRVHVLGDTIVDSHTYCSLIGATAKTPTFSVKYERKVDFVGGAGVVAKHLRKTGAAVTLSTVLGEDPLKDFVLNDLATSGVECGPCVDHTRPTTQKNVFIADGYRMLKVDRLDNRPISDKTLEQLCDSLTSSHVDAVLFSDFRHGIFSSQTIPHLTSAIPGGIFRAADSQVASRWGNILEFQGFDLITPNEREARFALGDQDSVIRPLAYTLYMKAKCKVLMLKLGDRGLVTYRAPSEDVRSFFTIDSFAERVVDPVGAGDALLAYATLALVATQSPVIASILGAMAAAVACEHEGNLPVSLEQILEKLQAVERQVRYEYV